MVTALLITRLPATFLAVDRKPRAQTLLLAIATMIVSIPAMNMLISLNNSITFPESLKALEIAMRHAEDAAAQSVDTLIGGNSVPSMIVSVLIVGVLAGFSEELFFRGAFQRLLTTGNVNKHLAIWLVAFCFSAMHMQFFGFFPRMLLGAFFGYLLYWSGSLWLPIFMHALNNSMYIIGSWAVGGDKSALNTYDDDISIVFLSIVLTAAGIYLIHRSAKHKTLINLI
jgi:hypothetical protein